jgi:hypothetical protein
MMVIIMLSKWVNVIILTHDFINIENWWNSFRFDLFDANLKIVYSDKIDFRSVFV